MSERSSGSVVKAELRDAVLEVRIERPEKRNALSRRVLSEIGEAFARHAGDASIKLALLTAAGDKAFAAGGDLQDFAGVREAGDAAELFELANRALHAVRRFPAPVVAVLNGMAVGGGAELAVACDFRVAARSASIGFVQARLAITTGFGGGSDLMALLGARRALRLLLEAEALGAAQALAVGLVDEVAAEGETLDACVARFVAPILRASPRVTRAYKAQALAARLGLSRAEREVQEREGFVATWIDPAHWEAVERVFPKGA